MTTRQQTGMARNDQAGDILIVVHEFVARSPDELSLAKGDRIELIERDDDFGDGWYLGRHLQNGQTGLFPEVYTTLAPKPALSGTAMAQANASRFQGQGFTSDGSDAKTPQADTPLNAPIVAYESFTLPHQTAAPSPTAQRQQTPTSPTGSTSFPGSLRSTPGGFSRAPTQHSAVMDETLNELDEHIADMSRPTLGVPGGPDRRPSNDSGSQYSIDMGRQPSIVNGAENDEEEGADVLSPSRVMQWSPAKVADYLEKAGVEKSHCEVFVEEEFSGEVLLGLDQSAILLQELQLGSIGRRMKTWAKIRALQEQVKASQVVQAASPPPSVTLGGFSSIQNQAPRPNFTTPNFSRGGAAAHLSSPRGSSMDFVDQIANKLPSPTLAGAQGPRPSAASIRSMAQSVHSRRQSSIDQTIQGTAHAKQASFDRSWTMAGRQGPQELRQPSYAGNSRPMSTVHLHSMSSDRSQFDRRQSQVPYDPAFDPDRGYTSGSELDVKRQRHLLRKPSPEDTRISYHEKKLSETIPGAQTRNESSRIVSAPVNGAMSPMITKLGEPSNVPRAERMSDIKENPTHSSNASMDRKGLRATSDVVTGREKALASSDAASTQSPTLAGSSTGSPSIASKADFVDANKSDFATPVQPPGAPSNARRKSKKATSAYVRGLEKKTPQEQMVGCDISGWMKKKSSNLMTTWKPRFFVLKGRRLSYYYSLNDKEEKGLIDISNHRVLPADNDFLTGLHATLTGAGSGPASPPMASTASPASASTVFSSDSTLADSGPASPARASTVPSTPLMKGDNQTFIFKLLPPRTGLSKAVNFTKPTVHYFAVPSLAEGRSWMAALMKATIDRDESAKVVTTYQQKTISLEKARARRERPPELRELADVDENAASAGVDEDIGADDDGIEDGARRIELRDAPIDDELVGSTRNSSVVSGSYAGDNRSGSGSGSGSGSVPGTGVRNSASLQRHSSSLRNSVALRQSEDAGLGIQGWNGNGNGNGVREQQQQQGEIGT